ncbi:MAG TPA: HlyD family efflux transporter periplasmic adaptor subunit [Bryobacteraceae bacterium]|nr:HlyD family efflux transporter periplasmic adaptor subunit [Bryobacteraceae bacterium]
MAYYLKTQSALKTAGGGPVITVPVVPVAIGDLRKTVRITGTVAAQNFMSLLAPRIQGSRSNTNRGGMGGNLMAGPAGGPGGADFNLILLKLVKAGTHVKKDDVVGEFDPTNQLQRLDDYKDAVIQNDNQVKKMLATLAANKETHDQGVRASKAAWQQALLDLQTIPVRSAIDAENYKLTAEQSEATYKQLQYEDGLLIESQRAQIRVQELNRGQTQIELQRADNNVKRMTIASPIDGIAVMASIVRNGEYGQVREGDQVNAGQPFLTIVDPRSMILNATVNQVDAERLRLGMKATVHLDAYPDVDLPGTLDGIGAMSKTSTFRAGYVGEIPVRLKIDKIDSRVIPDLTGSADVVLASESNTVVVPRAAVFEENGSSFVFVQGPEGWIKKQVEPGLSSFTDVAIHSGLQKGDVIALQRPL